MGEHKPDCMVYTSSYDGYPMPCTCGADGPATPTDAVEMAVETTEFAISNGAHPGGKVLRTLLTALREAQQQNSEQALSIVTMTHMHDALRKSVEMQAEEIKRLRGTILRYLDPVDMSVGSVRDLLDAVKVRGK